MYRLNCEITIGTYVFREVHEIEVITSWRTITDTATVKLPRRARFVRIKDENNNSDNENKETWEVTKLVNVIKSGDEVTIKLGYNDEITPVFIGYVREIKGRVPIEITCEDVMLKYKGLRHRWSKDNALLKDIRNFFANPSEFVSDSAAYAERLKQGDLSYAFEFETDEGTKLEDSEIGLGAVAYDNLSSIQILEKLRDDYGIMSYVKPGERSEEGLPIMVIGCNPYNMKTEVTKDKKNEKVFHFYGPKGNVVEDELVYRTEEDFPLTVSYEFHSKQNVVISSNDEIKDTTGTSVSRGNNSNTANTGGNGNNSDTSTKNINDIPQTNIIDTNIAKDRFGNRGEVKRFKYFGPEKNFTSFDADSQNVEKVREEVKNLAYNKLTSIVYNGFRGSMTTFGTPLVKHGDIVNLNSFYDGMLSKELVADLKEKDKTTNIEDIVKNGLDYFVDGVTYQFGVEGFRQVIVLGKRFDVKKPENTTSKQKQETNLIFSRRDTP
ncbi:hypothetical protein U6A24_13670 [Aquimarina gracilis]|uniref:Phage protein D n=1 Tax=Aquimarina gracilis TaxID=874422 RepID=A0ABU5ZXE3_9FLAO|nr:hypothetical protein [Aquimarina gracilis]MEB3346521.1 hypothetical protein [Aquimarina gracilis]